MAFEPKKEPRTNFDFKLHKVPKEILWKFVGAMWHKICHVEHKTQIKFQSIKSSK